MTMFIKKFPKTKFWEAKKLHLKSHGLGFRGRQATKARAEGARRPGLTCGDGHAPV
jgi:hypothetical protein